MNHSTSVCIDSLYSIRDIPSMGRSYALSVVDYLKAISFTTHVSFELRDLNHDKFPIELFFSFQPHLMVMFCLNSPCC
jgi:hypothetical protein